MTSMNGWPPAICSVKSVPFCITILEENMDWLTNTPFLTEERVFLLQIRRLRKILY